MVKPILFNTEMIRAILAGRKTVTRRLIKPQPKSEVFGHCGVWQESKPCANGVRIFTPPYKVGDILYVRETWTELCYVDENGYTHYDQTMYYYAADGTPDITLVDADGFELDDQRVRWKPSIHMPKEAARIFLRVAGVRVERLQDISPEEIIKEGVQLTARESQCKCALERPGCRQKPCRNRNAHTEGRLFCKFGDLWDRTIKAKDKSDYGFSDDPWVWVIEFERCERPVGF